MKRLLCTLAVLFALTPAVQAQNHGHQHADSSRAMPMDHDGMMDHDHMMSMEEMQATMPHMMRLHEMMMADSAMYHTMMADPDMLRTMQELMGGEMDLAQMRQQMADASPEGRQQIMGKIHAQMTARLDAMAPEQRRAMTERLMQVHQRMIQDPTMHDRIMANPEMHDMMEQMHEGGMMDHEDMMDHDKMNHQDMDHDGMDH